MRWVLQVRGTGLELEPFSRRERSGEPAGEIPSGARDLSRPLIWKTVVPGTGLEPARLSALDPKSSASANSAIPAGT